MEAKEEPDQSVRSQSQDRLDILLSRNCSQSKAFQYFSRVLFHAQNAEPEEHYQFARSQSR